MAKRNNFVFQPHDNSKIVQSKKCTEQSRNHAAHSSSSTKLDYILGFPEILIEIPTVLQVRIHCVSDGPNAATLW
jgi:hypothetical protein